VSLKLYEICTEMQVILDRIDPDDEKSLAETETSLQCLELDKEKKVINIGRLIKNLSAESLAIKTEIDNLAARKKSLDRQAEWLENYLTNTISGEKFNDPTVSISWRKSTSVNITDADAVPEEFLKVVPESRVPNKMLIKDLLMTGSPYVPGAELITKLNLQVK